MQALDRLSREELIALVHDLQGRLAARRELGPSAGSAAAIRGADARIIGASTILRTLAEAQRKVSENHEHQSALSESEARFRALVEASAQPVWITNARGEVDAEIPSWQRYTGLSFEQTRGEGWLHALHPEDRARAAQDWAEACTAGSVFDAEFRVRRHDGMWRHMHARAVPVYSADGSIREWVGMSTDITSLRESERQLDSILNEAAEAMLVVSSDGVIERFNLAAQRLFGYGAEEARTLNLRQLTVELAFDEATDTASQPHPTWIKPLLGGRREITGRRKDGTIFPLELSLSEIGMGPRPPRFTAVVRDITDRKSWENRIYTLAYTDSLTGLPNRLLLRDRLEHAIAAGQRNRSMVGVLFFDLDHFKAINDSYGHHVGDELLREIARRTTGCVREIDTVCRLGGDEFVLVLPELHDAADAGAVARKLLAVLSQPYEIDGHELHITPTLGISIFPQDGPDADALVRNADTAMYHAKESGKNDYRYFDPRIEESGGA